jgi:hypothetical protein
VVAGGREGGRAGGREGGGGGGGGGGRGVFVCGVCVSRDTAEWRTPPVPTMRVRTRVSPVRLTPLPRARVTPTPTPSTVRGLARARFHVGLAVAAEHPEALFFEGHQWLSCEPAAQAPGRALDLFLLAASKGHAEAACSAGAMHYNGVGTPTVRVGRSLCACACPVWCVPCAW